MPPSAQFLFMLQIRQDVQACDIGDRIRGTLGDIDPLSKVPV